MSLNHPSSANLQPTGQPSSALDSTYAPIPSVKKEARTQPQTTPRGSSSPAPGVSSSGMPWDLSDLTPQSEAQALAARTLSSYFQQLIKQGVATMASHSPVTEAIRKLFATSGGEAPDDVAARLMREDQTRWKNIKYVHVRTPPPRILQHNMQTLSLDWVSYLFLFGATPLACPPLP